MTSVTEGLLDVLQEALPESCALKRLKTELQNIAWELSTTTLLLPARLENRLRAFVISSNIQKSSSLWLLILLAGIFLPLSLASLLPSMQTRLVELQFLLYNFCGVLIFCGALTILGIQSMKWSALRHGNVHGTFRIHSRALFTFLLFVLCTIK